MHLLVNCLNECKFGVLSKILKCPPGQFNIQPILYVTMGAKPNFYSKFVFTGRLFSGLARTQTFFTNLFNVHKLLQTLKQSIKVFNERLVDVGEAWKPFTCLFNVQKCLQTLQQFTKVFHERSVDVCAKCEKRLCLAGASRLHRWSVAVISILWKSHFWFFWDNFVMTVCSTSWPYIYVKPRLPA